MSHYHFSLPVRSLAKDFRTELYLLVFNYANRNRVLSFTKHLQLIVLSSFVCGRL
jgi:hypothetical protein